MELINERETIKQAALGDLKALKLVRAHLQEMARKWGEDHANIEAQQFVIYSISTLNGEAQERFEWQLKDMIAQA